jgi:hypothetical protein
MSNDSKGKDDSKIGCGKIILGILALMTAIASMPAFNTWIASQLPHQTKSSATVDSLKQYKIGVYFHRNDASSKQIIDKIQGRLKKAGFGGEIDPSERDEQFFNKVVEPTSLEIRYDSNELEAAKTLYEIITETPEEKGKWKLREATNNKNPTNNFISIVVPRGL